MSEDIDIDESEIPSDAFHSTVDTGAVCPRSGEPAVEGINAWEFIGFPDLACWHKIAGREMSAEEFASALEAFVKEGKPDILTGFKSREGKPFAAALRPNAEENKWEFYFAPPVESQHKCPKSGKPVMISSGSYQFEGFPDVRFYKTVAKREMSVPDYIELLKVPGQKVLFRGFKSKAGKNFDAHLIFENGKVEFSFHK